MQYIDTLMWKELNETPRVLRGIMPENEAVMAALVREVREKNVRNVTGAARGTSDHALTFFKYATEILTDMKVGLAACSTVTMYDGLVNYGDNLVIGVSQSGRAADVLAVLERAKAQGAVTVAVTNNTESPMAKAAKYHLYCACGEEKSVAATKTFSAQVFLLLWLAARLADNGEVLARLPKVGDGLQARAEALGKAADAAVPFVKDIQNGFILSRGLTYALALESTLKLQETSYIMMKGYAESDFQHGPMAMVGDGTPVIVYAPKIGFGTPSQEENRRADFAKMLTKLAELKAEVLVVSDDDVYPGAIKIEGAGSELFTVFDLALFAQMLACKVSCAVGNNPDSPRALKKVTVTK